MPTPRWPRRSAIETLLRQLSSNFSRKPMLNTPTPTILWQKTHAPSSQCLPLTELSPTISRDSTLNKQLASWTSVRCKCAKQKWLKPRRRKPNVFGLCSRSISAASKSLQTVNTNVPLEKSPLALELLRKSRTLSLNLALKIFTMRRLPLSNRDEEEAKNRLRI